MENVNLANRNLQLFSYNVSHDLRQPLRMISSYVQLLKRRFSEKLDKEGAEYIDFAYQGAMSAQKLVNDLLQYARIGVNEEDFELLDLNKILIMVLTNLQMEIRAANPQIIYPELPQINGVKTLIIQLFQNLIHNALKFRGKAQSIIEISVEDKATHYLFYLSDNGIGMPTEVQHTIFDAFVRSQTHENVEGTGLGLAISKKIVEKHNGEIRVTSEIEKGSTFHFSIGK